MHTQSLHPQHALLHTHTHIHTPKHTHAQAQRDAQMKDRLAQLEADLDQAHTREGVLEADAKRADVMRRDLALAKARIEDMEKVGVFCLCVYLCVCVLCKRLCVCCACMCSNHMKWCSSSNRVPFLTEISVFCVCGCRTT